MENAGRPSDPYEIEIIIPQTIELIDPSREPEYFLPAPPVRQFRSRKRLALFLFLATCASTLFAGMYQEVERVASTILSRMTILEIVGEIGLLHVVLKGLAYAIPVMAILLAHEMGHYLQARRYGVPASLPYFIPMPITPLGTMGAVIVQGGGVADRKQMFDIAISGPLAGLVFAIPAAYYGLWLSNVVHIPNTNREFVFGMPLVFQWMAEAIHGPLAKGHGIEMSPLAFAGWVGILVTAINLIPIGQLDGGHILYCLLGKRAHIVAMVLLWAAVVYMIYTRNVAYSLMIVLLMLMGPRHPPTRDDTVPLGAVRIVLGWLTLAFIIIGFTPTPIRGM